MLAVPVTIPLALALGSEVLALLRHERAAVLPEPRELLLRRAALERTKAAAF